MEIITKTLILFSLGIVLVAGATEYLSADISLPKFDGNYSKINIPYGEQPISLRIDYPNMTNNCITMNKVAMTSTTNIFTISVCDKRMYYENLTSLLKQDNYNVTTSTEGNP